MNRNALLLALWFSLAPFALRGQSVEIHGHRGARGHYPENTVAGFIKAVELGAEWIELDVILTADSVLIVSHEGRFNHKICDCPPELKKAMFYEMKAADIQKIDCGSKGHPAFKTQQKAAAFKPTLSQVFDSLEKRFPNGGVRYNVEIKAGKFAYGKSRPTSEQLAQKVYAALKERNLLNRCLIQSFDAASLNALYAIDPTLRLGFLVFSPKSVAANLKKLTFKPYTYNPYYKWAKKKTVRYAHERGIKVIPWTMNDEKNLKKMLKLGVDGLISDFPDRAKKAVQEVKGGQ